MDHPCTSNVDIGRVFLSYPKFCTLAQLMRTPVWFFGPGHPHGGTNLGHFESCLTVCTALGQNLAIQFQPGFYPRISNSPHLYCESIHEPSNREIVYNKRIAGSDWQWSEGNMKFSHDWCALILQDAEGLAETAQFYGVSPECMEGVAHDMMLDVSWEKGAQLILSWLNDLNKLNIC